MSETTDPAALLREAARLLRERAASVPAGPWWAHLPDEDGDEWQVAVPPPPELGSTFADGWFVASDLGEDVARWISLMSPAVAEPVARHLDVLADLTTHGQAAAPGRHTAASLARAIYEAVAAARRWYEENPAVTR